jgi:hypothetical protein
MRISWPRNPLTVLFLSMAFCNRQMLSFVRRKVFICVMAGCLSRSAKRSHGKTSLLTRRTFLIKHQRRHVQYDGYEQIPNWAKDLDKNVSHPRRYIGSFTVSLHLRILGIVAHERAVMGKPYHGLYIVCDDRASSPSWSRTTERKKCCAASKDPAPQ